MKIAFLAHDFPYPPVSGVRQRSWALVNAFSLKNEVYFFCLGSSSQAPGLGPNVQFTAVARGAKTPWRLAWDFLVEPFYFKGFSRAFVDAVAMAHRRERFDVIHCESLNMALYAFELKRRLGVATTLTFHNAEGRLYLDLIKTEKNPVRRVLGLLQWLRVRAAEKEVLAKLDAAFSYSAPDHEYFERLGPARRLLRTTCGCDAAGIKPRTEGKKNHLAFIGSLSYYPNQQGLLWFLDKVFPELPGFTLTIAGSGTQPELMARAASFGGRVALVESPPDVLPFLLEAQAEIVPLWVGGGVRGKILEAFAAGKPVVSTTKGAEGLEVEPGKDLLLADTAPAFAAALRRLADDPALAKGIGSAARRKAEERYSWDGIAAEILKTYETLLPLPSAAVLVASKRPDVLPRCLASLEAQTLKPAEVLVIWQGSDTATRDAALAFARRSELPVKAVHSPIPGIVPAENAGLDACAAEIAVFLDDDATAPPRWLKRHLERFRDPRVGAVGGPIVNRFPDGREFPKRAARPVAKIAWHGRLLDNIHDHAEEFRSRPVENVDFLMGCNMSLRRAAFDRFESRLKPYWQQFEIDACLQVKARGYRVLFDYANPVDHFSANTHVGDTRDGDLQIKMFNPAYNRAFVLGKHSRGAFRRAARLAYMMLVGTRKTPGPLGLPFALLRHGHPLRELSLMRETLRAQWDGWRAGSRR